ncbi:DUF4291 domain-containing protein [Kribbella amoyensis]|nr:DUF4291 domain-containing protein [Kribbella amoyensis]
MNQPTNAVPRRQIRALYDDQTIAVYQAYSPEIAGPAVAAGTFVPPFGLHRMTWIKPSFLWMAYRSGWATKPGQTRVLRIHLTREGFEWALTHSCLSHYDRKHHPDESAWRAALRESPVRIQWDPEQTLHLKPQPDVRSIQIGLAGEAVPRYVHDWITRLEDVTTEMQEIHALTRTDSEAARSRLPAERPYPLTDAIAQHIAASPFD